MRCEFSWDNGDLTWYMCTCERLKGHDGDHECACGERMTATKDGGNPTPDAGGHATAGPASHADVNPNTMESPK